VDAVILRNRAEQDAENAARRIDHQRDLKDWSAWLARAPRISIQSIPSIPS
jgi:hypothetical protein